MKNKILLIIFLSLVLLFLLGKFHFSKTYFIGREISVKNVSKIDCQFWKNNGGAIDNLNDDLLNFKNSNIAINNDTLLVNKQPIAIIYRLVHRSFIDYEMTLKSLDGNQTSYFVSK